MLSTNEIVRIAGEAKVNPATVRDFLTGKHSPHASTLDAIRSAADRLGIKLPKSAAA